MGIQQNIKTMLSRKATNPATVSTLNDDMASVSTFTASGHESEWGYPRDNSNKSGRRKRKRRLRGGGSGGNYGRRGVGVLAMMILVFGLIAGIIFSRICLRAENISRRNEFERGASVTVAKIGDSFGEYADVASLIHGRCRHRPLFDASALENDPKNYTDYYTSWSDEFRDNFRELYEYVNASGLKFKAMQFDPNITNQERPMAESEAGAFYGEQYPEVNYTGFRGFNGNSSSLEPRWRNQSFYFPIHYMEPIQGNEAAIDLDYYSSESRIRAVEALFESRRPSLTDRLSLVKKAGRVSRCSSGRDPFSGDQGPSFGVVLMHPGVKLSADDETSWPRDFSSIVLCMSDLMRRSTEHQNRKKSVYIHDLSHPKEDDPVFMGAARLSSEVVSSQNGTSQTTADQQQSGSSTDPEEVYTMKLLDEVSLGDLSCDLTTSCYQRTIEIANRKWTVTVLDEEDIDRHRLVFIRMIGVLVFAASVCLAVWVIANDRRNRTYSALKSKAATERNALVLENANRAAQTERELNDFLAHEVRNPLAAAMAATQFLRTELDRRSKSNEGIHVHFDDSEGEHMLDVDDDVDGDDDDGSLTDDDSSETVPSSSTSNMMRELSTKTISSPRLVQAREDVRVIDHALRFINDLLRNMLDMHRAASNQLQVNLAPADLLRDVLEPVAGMLYRGGEGRIGRNGKGDDKVQIIVDCPENMFVTTDVLRLKQVILNLGRNSVKFIHEGFIRLRVEVVEANGEDNDSIVFCDENENENGFEDYDIEAASTKWSANSRVRVYVEDSGSGIPMGKRERLFAKYQESLDLLSQGTVRT